MLQWFLRFSEFTEFNESSTPFRENSSDLMCQTTEVDFLCVIAHTLAVESVPVQSSISRQKLYLHEFTYIYAKLLLCIAGIRATTKRLSIWFFHDRRFCQIIWQIFTQGKAKKIHQKLPPVGIETRTSISSGQCLTNWTRQESVGQEISKVSFVCFMHHFTCWTLLISRINRAWLYKGHEYSGWQLNVDLAQLVRHCPDITWHFLVNLRL